MDDKKIEYSTIDLHQHSVYSQEEPKATLKVREMLEYYRLLAEIRGKRVAFAITDHDNVDGAYVAWRLMQMYPEKYANIDFVPGMEMSVSCDRVLTYEDEQYHDQKFIFKQMHVLVHAKQGREEEFFKRAWIISKLNKMILPDVPNARYNSKIVAKDNYDKKEKHIYIGGIIIAARHLLAEQYGVKIPYSHFADCIQDGLTYEQIREKFIEVVYAYISSNSEVFEQKTKEIALQEISRVITAKKDTKNPAESKLIFPRTQQKIRKFFGLSRVDICELRDIFGDTATLCYAHPQTLTLHKHTEIPVSAFQGVDFSSLPSKFRRRIAAKLNNAEQIRSGRFTEQEIMYGDGDNYCFNNDYSGIIKLQILHKALKEKGVVFDGYEVTPRVARRGYVFDIMDTVVDTCGLALNFGTDKHYNQADRWYFDADAQKIPADLSDTKPSEMYYARYSALAVSNPYFMLNRKGYLSEEDQTFIIQHSEEMEM